KPGDVVLLFPWWTERARLFMPDGVPVVGYLGSDGDDLTRSPRIWVLAEPRLPKASRSAFDAAFLPNRTRLSDPRTFGNLELTVFANNRYRPALFSAADALAAAHVYLENPQGQRSECQPDASGFSCGADDEGQPVRVGVEWHEVKFMPRHCVH